MFNSYKILLPTLLAIATSAIAQPSFRITSFISHRDITDSQNNYSIFRFNDVKYGRNILEYMNSRHGNIKFTLEVERDNQLFF